VQSDCLVRRASHDVTGAAGEAIDNPSVDIEASNDGLRGNMKEILYTFHVGRGEVGGRGSVAPRRDLL
jgi:hypothetical protein